MSLASDYAAAFQAELLTSRQRESAVTGMRPPDFESKLVHASVTVGGQMALRGEGVVDVETAVALGVWITQNFGAK